MNQSTTEFLFRQFSLLRIKNPRETSQNSGTRRLFDPRWFPMDEYWWNFSVMESRNNLCSKLKNGPTFTNLYLLRSSFPLFLFFIFFFAFGQGSYKLPNDLTSQHSLGCRPEFSHMALVARSVGMILVLLIFKTHTVGTDVFHGDCKMKFRKQEAWAMLEYSVVSGHSVRLTPADNHSCCLGKEVYNTCV